MAVSVLPFPGAGLDPSAEPRPAPPRTPRWLVVHLPAFRLERCGVSPDELAGLLDEERNALRVVALTPAAHAEGLRRGATAAEARAQLPEIVLLRLDREAESRDRAELLRAFSGLSDAIATLGEDDLLLEVSRTAHLFGGEAGVVAEASAQADRLGHRAHVAVADDPRAAAAFARWSLAPRGIAAEIVPMGAGGTRLAGLPLIALGPSPALLAGWRAVGLRWIGELAGLDAASVRDRWGDEGLALLRIARGEPVGPPERAAPVDAPVVVSAQTPGATTLDQLGFALSGLVHHLVAELAARDQAVVQARLQLQLDHQAPLGVSVRLGRPTRDASAILRQFTLRLAQVRLAAPVTGVAIEVVEAAPALGWQPGLVDRTEASEPIPDLIARLQDALGVAAVFQPVLVSSWRPEAAWRPGPYPLTAPPVGLPPAAVEAAPLRLVTDPVEAQTQWAPPLPRPRPVLLLPVPEPIEVGLNEGRPARLQRAGSTYALERVEGPERLVGEWWQRSDPLEREYWIVRWGGRSAWIFHARGRWCLHGWFD